MKNAVFACSILFLFSISSYAQVPDWKWARAAGSKDGPERGKNLAIDSKGNIYVIGDFLGNLIKFGNKVLYNVEQNGSTDLFVVKYDMAGNVIWAKSFGSAGSEVPTGIAIDPDDNVLITGNFFGPSITFGSTAYSGNRAIFVVKLNSSGNPVWVKIFDPPDNNNTANANAIITDANGNFLITGYFRSASIAFDNITLTNLGMLGYEELFVAKGNAQGTILWAKSASGYNDDSGSDITTDYSGNVWVLGNFRSDSMHFENNTLVNFNPDIPLHDLFIAKYDSSGNFAWVKSAGGTDPETGTKLAADGKGNVIFTGFFRSSPIYFDTYSLLNTSGCVSCYDVFLAKYDGSGNVDWVKKEGGAKGEGARGIFIDSTGNILVAGFFDSPTITFDTTTLANKGQLDLFIAKYDSSGNVLWAKHAGGNGSEYIYDLAEKNGKIYITGEFYESAEFDNIYLQNAGTYGSDVYLAALMPGETTGIPGSDNPFLIYPNPTKGNFTLIVPLEATHVVISDLVGKVLRHETIEKETVFNFNLDVSGIYLVQIQTLTGMIMKKIVVCN